MTSFWFLYSLLWTYLTPCYSIYIVNFDKVNADWVVVNNNPRTLHHLKLAEMIELTWNIARILHWNINLKYFAFFIVNVWMQELSTVFSLNVNWNFHIKKYGNAGLYHMKTICKQKKKKTGSTWMSIPLIRFEKTIRFVFPS